MAGCVALLLSANPTLTPGRVAAGVFADATPNKITNPGTGSSNRLLFCNGTPGDTTVPNPGNMTGTVGTPVSLLLVATGGSRPYVWSTTGLPPGVSIDLSTGLIHGTPTAMSSIFVTVTVTDIRNRSATAFFGWTISADGAAARVPPER